MFRTTRSQKTAFDHDVCLLYERIAALKKSWAGPFREKILPLIDEEPFGLFYHPDNGRPNAPVDTLIGVSVLKEMRDFTDNKASLTETCSEGNAFQAITEAWVDGAHVSDQTDVPKVIERLEEAKSKPEELFADAGHGRGENIVACREEGVALTAPNTLGNAPDMNKIRSGIEATV